MKGMVNIIESSKKAPGDCTGNCANGVKEKAFLEDTFSARCGVLMNHADIKPSHLINLFNHHSPMSNHHKPIILNRKQGQVTESRLFCGYIFIQAHL